MQRQELGSDDILPTLGDTIAIGLGLLMATFILVHGTFARAAHWPALRLALAAGAAGEHSRFEELIWSGKNRASARQAAASEISSVVQNIQSTSKNEKIFIIGHSHGGSAIAYFLKEYSSLAKTVSGCAFLSTPFMAIRPRTHTFDVAAVMSYFPVAAFNVFWPYIPRYLNGPDFGRLNTHDPVYLLGICLSTALIGLIFFTLRKFRNPEKLLEEAHRRQTANLPHGNYLFLRCSGDEAAEALSAFQIITLLSMKLSQWLELLTRPLLSSRKTVGIVSWMLIGGPLVWASGPAAGFVDAAVVRDIRHDFPYLLYLYWYFCVFILPPLIAFGALAAFLIFLAQALTSWAFGWTEFFTGFFIELAIEPLPFGANSMLHIDWSTKPPGIEGITHSWTYAHPVAILYVQDWVKTTLSAARHSTSV
jgi:hypothetical protein